jgi:hypothetical protein
MTSEQQAALAVGDAKRRNSTTALLVGNIEPAMEWRSWSFSRQASE